MNIPFASIHLDAADALDRLLGDLFSSPELVDRPQGMIHELLGVTVGIEDSRKVLISSPARKFNYRSHISEGLWNCADTDRIHFLERYVSGIRSYISNQEPGDQDRATWAYGKYLNSQLLAAGYELINDPSSRRARASIQYDGARGTPPCLTSLQWFIRDGQLHQITNMRSNDVWRGFPLDVVQFSLIQQMMAAFVRVRPGTYVHQIGSLHLYERDLEQARSYYANGMFEVHSLPPPGPSALITATRGNVLLAVDVAGHTSSARSAEPNYEQVSGLETYTALLAGDYSSPYFGGSVYADLKASGSGIGW